MKNLKTFLIYKSCCDKQYPQAFLIPKSNAACNLFSETYLTKLEDVTKNSSYTACKLIKGDKKV